MKNQPDFHKPRVQVKLSLVQFRAQEEHIEVVLILDNQIISLTFESPEQIAEFSLRLMDEASKVWPDHWIIREYKSDD